MCGVLTIQRGEFIEGDNRGWGFFINKLESGGAANEGTTNPDFHYWISGKSIPEGNYPRFSDSCRVFNTYPSAPSVRVSG